MQVITKLLYLLCQGENFTKVGAWRLHGACSCLQAGLRAPLLGCMLASPACRPGAKGAEHPARP